jgi:hypothetical protein
MISQDDPYLPPAQPQQRLLPELHHDVAAQVEIEAKA